MCMNVCVYIIYYGITLCVHLRNIYSMIWLIYYYGTIYICMYYGIVLANICIILYYMYI